jgi:hypothetical protein
VGRRDGAAAREEVALTWIVALSSGPASAVIWVAWREALSGRLGPSPALPLETPDGAAVSDFAFRLRRRRCRGFDQERDLDIVASSVPSSSVHSRLPKSFRLPVFASTPHACPAQRPSSCRELDVERHGFRDAAIVRSPSPS